MFILIQAQSKQRNWASKTPIQLSPMLTPPLFCFCDQKILVEKQNINTVVRWPLSMAAVGVVDYENEHRLIKELRLACLEQKEDIIYVAMHGSELSDMGVDSLVKPKPSNPEVEPLCISRTMMSN